MLPDKKSQKKRPKPIWPTKTTKCRLHLQSDGASGHRTRPIHPQPSGRHDHGLDSLDARRLSPLKLLNISPLLMRLTGGSVEHTELRWNEKHHLYVVCFCVNSNFAGGVSAIFQGPSYAQSPPICWRQCWIPAKAASQVYPQLEFTTRVYDLQFRGGLKNHPV